jgi:exopolysaccharide production protein ExoZ
MKYTNIQVLRFIAAGGVLLLHLGIYSKAILGFTGPVVDALNAPICWAGVPVFFAVSGFVLTHSLQTTPVRQFLLLRAVRIYPPLWVAAAVVVVATGVAGALAPSQFLRAMLLVPVGPDRAQYVLGIEWSLVYEVFFYCALAILAAFGPRRALPIGAVIWLGACLGRMIVAPHPALVLHPTWRNIALSAVNLPFLFGVIAYYLRRSGPAFRLWAPVIAPPLLVGAALIPSYDGALLALGLGSGLLVAWAAAVPQLAGDHPLVRYGDFSYGVFLIHVPILKAVLGFFEGLPPTLIVVATAGLIALSAGSMYGSLETALYRRLRNWICGPARKPIAPVAEMNRAA